MEVMSEVIVAQTALPPGWERLELSEFAEKSSRKFYPNTTTEPTVCVELEHVSQVTGQLIGTTQTTPQSSTKNAFTQGEVIFGKLRPYLRKYLRPKFDGVCSSEFWVLRGKPKKCLNEFLFYLVQSEPFVQACAKTTGSKMPRADWDLVQEQPFLLPPKSEQQRIATILSACDRAIEGTALLLEKQEKRKKALTNDLLHLNSLSIPKGWAMREVGDFVSALESGVSVNSTGDDKLGSTKRILKTSAVFNGEFYPEKNKIITKADEKRAKLNPRANAIIISRMNTVELVGQSGYVRESSTDVYLPDRLWQTVFRDENALSVKWLSYYLSSDRVRSSIRNAASGTSGSMKNIAQEAFLKIPVLAPPVAKQHTIARILETADKEIKLLRQQHKLLQQQKKGLMQRLLTGQPFTN